MYYVVYESKDSTFHKEGYELFRIAESSHSGPKVGSYGGDFPTIHWEVKEEVASLEEGVKAIEKKWLGDCGFRVEGEGEERKWYVGRAEYLSMEGVDGVLWGDRFDPFESWVKELFDSGLSLEEAAGVVARELNEDLEGECLVRVEYAEECLEEAWEILEKGKR